MANEKPIIPPTKEQLSRSVVEAIYEIRRQRNELNNLRNAVLSRLDEAKKFLDSADIKLSSVAAYIGRLQDPPK